MMPAPRPPQVHANIPGLIRAIANFRQRRHHRQRRRQPGGISADHRRPAAAPESQPWQQKSRASWQPSDARGKAHPAWQPIWEIGAVEVGVDHWEPPPGAGRRDSGGCSGENAHWPPWRSEGGVLRMGARARKARRRRRDRGQARRSVLNRPAAMLRAGRPATCVRTHRQAGQPEEPRRR